MGDYPDFPKDGLDFSVNVNPLGYPERVGKTLIENVTILSSYPDYHYRVVRKNVSEYLGVEEKFTALGNGSMELIDLLIQNASRVLIMEPCFSEYRNRANIHGVPVELLDESFLKKGDMVILGNPNNPTGKLLELDIEKLYCKVRAVGAFLVLDETFIEFADRERNSIEFFGSYNYDFCAIIRAATKFFGLPGLRFGYGAMSEERVDMISKRQNPWSLNAMVEPISEVIFKDYEFISESKALIREERERLEKLYEKLIDFTMMKTDANFYLLKMERISANKIFQFLLNCKIMARSFGSKILGGEYLRFAIRTAEDNDRLIEALKKAETI